MKKLLEKRKTTYTSVNLRVFVSKSEFFCSCPLLAQTGFLVLKFCFWNIVCEILLVKSRILGSGVQNTALRIWNPTNDWNSESKFHWQILESRIQNCLDYLTWGEIINKLKYAKTVFSFSNYAYLSLREPKRRMFPLYLSTFSSSSLWILYSYSDHVADGGILLTDNILLQVKRDALGK